MPDGKPNESVTTLIHRGDTVLRTLDADRQTAQASEADESDP